MKKRSGAAAIVLLCVVLANIPARLYAWEWRFPARVKNGWVKGTIQIRGQDWQFVGVNLVEHLWDAGHAAWAEGPDEVIALTHPDPNVNPAIINWMRRNDVQFAITFVYDEGNPDVAFMVTRRNSGSGGSYSTLYYSGGR